MSKTLDAEQQSAALKALEAAVEAVGYKASKIEKEGRF